MSTSSSGEKRASPGQGPGMNGVLHQRRSLPFGPATLALGGLLIAGTIGYFALNAKSKPGNHPNEASKVSSSHSHGDRH